MPRFEVGKASLHVTVCISVATLDDFQFHDEDDLLRALERVLYRTAATSSNRVVAAGKLGTLKGQIRPARRRIRFSVIVLLVIAVGFLSLFFVAPAWTCAPLRLADILDSSELPPPLPPDCFSTIDNASDAVLQSLDTQRELKAFNCSGRIPAKYNPHPLQPHGQIVPKISNRWMKSTRAASYAADVMLCWSRPRMFAEEPCSHLRSA
jgi:hypothetical protein